MSGNYRRADGDVRKKLIDWATWYFADNTFDCSLCRVVQGDGAVDYQCDGLEAENGICPQGKIPVLWPEHHDTWRLFLMMYPGLITDIGFNYGAIESVFEIEEIENKYRKRIFDDVLKLINIVKAERGKRTNDGKGKQLECAEV